MPITSREAQEHFAAEDEKKRNPWPQFNNFRPWLVNELTRRKNDQLENGASTSTMAAPFVRMTSCMREPILGYHHFTLGLHGYEANDENLFDMAYMRERDIVGYAYDNGKQVLISADQLTVDESTQSLSSIEDVYGADKKNAIQAVKTGMLADQSTDNIVGAFPIPGILSADITRMGIGQPFRADVTWRCYTRQQLEYLRNHFLIGAGYIVLEWGHNFAEFKPMVDGAVLDFTDEDSINEELSNSIIEGRKFVLNNYNAPNGGNYDFIVGMASQFNIEFNAEFNFYDCTTTIISSGENIYGVSATVFPPLKLPNGKDAPPNNLTTIDDFFHPGGMFDKLINNYRGQKGYDAFIANNNAGASEPAIGTAPYSVYVDLRNTQTNEIVQTRSVSINSGDLTYISWRYFIEVIIPYMHSVVQDQALKTEIMQFLKLYIPFDDKALEGKTPEQMKASKEDLFKAIDNVDVNLVDWVGINANLKSVDPESMILIHKGITPASSTAWALAAGYCDDWKQSGGFRGHLSKGVWLNASMIRAVFQGTRTFIDGFKGVLNAMNAAVAGYWNLKLFFDEDAGYFRVVDEQFGDYKQAITTEFYRFNDKGAPDTIGIELESAYPPELVMQLSLYSQFKTKSAGEQMRMLQEYPSLGQASSFIFAMNWSSLEDGLSKVMKSKYDSINPSTNTEVSRNPADGASTVGGLLSNERVTDLAKSNTSPAMGKPLGKLTSVVAESTKVDKVLTKLKNFGKKVQKSSLGKTVGLIAHTIDEASTYTNLDQLQSNDFRYQVEELISRLKQEGYKVVIGEVFRPQSEQDKLYNQRPIVTQTKDSVHTYGGAVDLQIFTEQNDKNRYKDTYPYQRMRQIVKDDPQTFDLIKFVDLTTGPDWPHVEMKNARKVLTKKDSSSVPSPKATDPSTKDPLPQSETNRPTSPDASTAQVNVAPVQLTQAEADNFEIIKAKFGTGFETLIAQSVTQMINNVRKHGILNYPKLPNGFVAPFPTTSKVRVKMPGIAGFSVSDAFTVDRLPFVFEKYGCFQVIEYRDSISESGWITTITGYFKMIWIDGEGNQRRNQ